MSTKRQCRFCQNFKIKKGFLGKITYLCSVQNCKVTGSGSCNKFTPDAYKILDAANFRSHEFGSKKDCHTCAFLNGKAEKGRTVYHCEKHQVYFGRGYSTTDYICDSFKDGGMDALISRLAESMIEVDEMKKR